MMMMVMTFSKSATVLFDKWKFHTVGGLIGSMVAIYILAFAYEGVKFLRAYLYANAITIRQNNRDSGDDRFTRLNILSKSHLIQTVFYCIQAILGYFLMLIFMTYNAWLCIAVIMGLVCGYFIFGWRTPVVNDFGDHCT